MTNSFVFDMRRFWIITVLLFTTTCSSSTGDRPHSFHIFDENGVTVAESSGGPKYWEPPFICEESFRIHEDDSVPESLLATPDWMGMDEDGMVYLVDKSIIPADARILVYDQSGEFSHKIGQTGYGPGDYQSPRITKIRDGIITIYDRSLRRISFFSTNGQLLDLLTVKPGELGIPDLAYSLSDDRMIMIYQLRRGGYPDPISYSAYRAAVLSADEDTLGIVETPYTASAQIMNASIPGDGLIYFSTPALYIPNAVLDIYPPKGIMVTTGTEPVVRWYTLYGRLHSEYRLGIDRMPVTDRDRELVDSHVESNWPPEYGYSQVYLNTWRRDAEFPELKALWKAAQIDEYGYLWLEDSGTEFHPTERLFRVVDPQGEYLGDCALPQGNGRISYGHYLLIDENWMTGEQNLIVYRLSSAIRGLEYP